MSVKQELYQRKETLGLRLNIGLRRAKAIGQYVTGQSPDTETEPYWPVVRGDMAQVRQRLTQSVRQVVVAAVERAAAPPRLKRAAAAAKPTTQAKPSGKAKVKPKPAAAKTAAKGKTPSKAARAKKA